MDNGKLYIRVNFIGRRDEETKMADEGLAFTAGASGLHTTKVRSGEH